MCALEANCDATVVLIGLEKLRDFTIVVGIVENVSGRKTMLVPNVLQSLHYYLKQAGIGRLPLVKLLIERFFHFSR